MKKIVENFEGIAELLEKVDYIVQLFDEANGLMTEESELYDAGKVDESNAKAEEMETMWESYEQAVEDLVFSYKRLKND